MFGLKPVSKPQKSTMPEFQDASPGASTHNLELQWHMVIMLRYRGTKIFVNSRERPYGSVFLIPGPLPVSMCACAVFTDLCQTNVLLADLMRSMMPGST